MFGGAYRFKNLENNFLDMDKACHTYFSVTGKIFVINCHIFQGLFMSYMHLVTQSPYFWVHVTVSLLIYKRNTRRSAYIAIILIKF